MMVKRNLQMEEEAMKLMISKTSQESINMDDQNKQWENFQNKKYHVELECAIQMSLALEKEKKKLKELEDEEFRRALEISKLEEEIKSKNNNNFSGSIKIRDQKIIEQINLPLKIQVMTENKLEIIPENVHYLKDNESGDNSTNKFKFESLIPQRDSENEILTTTSSNRKTNDDIKQDFLPESRKNENIKINKDKATDPNVLKIIQSNTNSMKKDNKDKFHEIEPNKKQVFLNNPNSFNEDGWNEHMKRLGINKLINKDIKRNQQEMNNNKFDDEFNDVFEVSEKLTFEEELNIELQKKNQKELQELENKTKKEKEELDKSKKLAQMEKQTLKDKEELEKSKQKDLDELMNIKKNQVQQNLKAKQEPKNQEEKNKLYDIKLNNHFAQDVASEGLNIDNSNKIVHERILKDLEIQNNQESLIAIKSSLLNQEKNISENLNSNLNSSNKRDIKNIDINPINDDVELKNSINWNAQNLSQSTSNIGSGEEWNFNKIDKTYKINHEMPDLSGVKPKIDTGLRNNNTKTNNLRTSLNNNYFQNTTMNLIMNKNNNDSIKLGNLKEQNIGKNDVEDKYNEFENDNKNKLKQFIQTVMTNKVEKRNNFFEINNVKLIINF